MKLYVVRNKDGKYFRSKGYGGDGETWVDNLEKAKFYAKYGQAQARSTFFAGNYPEYGVPVILEFTLDVSNAKVIDASVAQHKAIEKRKAVKEERQRKLDAWYASRPK